MLTPTLLYLFGPPGAGKTTLADRLLRDWRPALEYEEPFSFVYRVKGAESLLELGRRRPPFSGTDTLSMSVGPLACAWIGEQPHQRVVAEGDRLAYDGFWEAAARAGYRLWLVCLDAPDRVLAGRRVQRSIGRQNPTWQTGRASKARLLADRWDALRLDATTSVADLCVSLRAHPYAEEFLAA